MFAHFLNEKNVLDIWLSYMINVVQRYDEHKINFLGWDAHFMLQTKPLWVTAIYRNINIQSRRATPTAYVRGCFIASEMEKCNSFSCLWRWQHIGLVYVCG